MAGRWWNQGHMTSVVKPFMSVVRAAGEKGLMNTFLEMRMLKYSFPGLAECVGEDHLGNKYYYNENIPVGRNRFVVFKNMQYGEFGWDATQVPVEWHAWLHGMTDDLPSEKPQLPKIFKADHTELRISNLGTKASYLPDAHFLKDKPLDKVYERWGAIKEE
jgi:NADH:ubiquinone oxidoreductase subunit